MNISKVSLRPIFMSCAILFISVACLPYVLEKYAYSSYEYSAYYTYDNSAAGYCSMSWILYNSQMQSCSTGNNNSTKQINDDPDKSFSLDSITSEYSDDTPNNEELLNNDNNKTSVGNGTDVNNKRSCLLI